MLAMNLGYTDKQNLTTIARRKDCQKTGLLSLWSGVLGVDTGLQSKLEGQA